MFTDYMHLWKHELMVNHDFLKIIVELINYEMTVNMESPSFCMCTSIDIKPISSVTALRRETEKRQIIGKNRKQVTSC